MVLGNGAFGGGSGHDDRVLINGISDFIKEAPEWSLPSSSMWCFNKSSTQWHLGGSVG